MPCFGHSAVVVQSLRGTDPRILERGDFADEERLCFSQRWSFLFPNTRLAHRGLSESNFSNSVQDFLHRVSPKLFGSLRNECIRLLWYTTQLWYAFRDSHNAFVFTFSTFWEVVFFQPFVLLFMNFVMRKQTRVSRLTTRFCFIELALGRMPMFTRSSRAGTLQIISARCRAMDPRLLLPRMLLFSDTLRPRVTVGSEGVAAVCSGFCARSWVMWRRLQQSPCEHWPFSFHW